MKSEHNFCGEQKDKLDSTLHKVERNDVIRFSILFHFMYKHIVDIITAIKKNTSIKRILLRWIQFNNDELYMNHFIESIEHNENIKVLQVRDYGIETNGAILLAKMLEGNTTIKKVQLDYNYIEPEGAIAFVNMLKRNNTITELDLGNNHIGDEGARAFISALGVNRTIERLNITGNNLS